jgi:Ca2+-transporting ATPase
LVGLLGIADPPRTEAAEAIKEARGAGIIPVMITGDHPKTATAIAREMGLVLENDPLHERVHARATPEDKLRLVRQWKNSGHIVAMTGDGVNDAPALREAHIGIAMGKTGTEVTRQAADLILADDNFATIVAAVSEGRSIFQNIRRAISYLLVGNLAEIAIVLFCIVLGLPMPLLAAHLLWINLVTDAFPALTLIAEPLSPLTMKRPPRPVSEPLLGRPEWGHILSVGLLEAGVCIVMYWLLLRDHSEDHARGLLFSGLVFSQLLRSFSARCNTRTLWEAGVFTNLWLLAVVLVTGSLQVGLHFIPFTQRLFGLSPLGLEDLSFVLPFALIPVSLLELKKVGQRLAHF